MLFRLLMSFLFFTITSAWSASERLTLSINGKTVVFSLPELKRSLKVSEIRIKDPVYKKEMSFDGFKLSEVLSLGGLPADSRDDEIVFTAKDGYSPNASFEKVRSHEAYLVFQEHGKKGFVEKVQQGKARVSPAPFYVVWSEGEKLEHEVPWPYQLVKIEVVNFKAKYPKLLPKDSRLSSSETHGFKIFKNECMRCHSINLEGGDLGPELNVPKNVTEYLDGKFLKDFIRNPSSFRARDKMPSFPQLTDEDMNHLIAYLKAMAGNKAVP